MGFFGERKRIIVAFDVLPIRNLSGYLIRKFCCVCTLTNGSQQSVTTEFPVSLTLIATIRAQSDN